MTHILSQVVKGATSKKALTVAGEAAAAGAAWVIGGAVAGASLVIAKKAPTAIKAAKGNLTNTKLMLQYVVVPAVRAKAASLFTRKGKAQPKSTTPVDADEDLV